LWKTCGKGGFEVDNPKFVFFVPYSTGRPVFEPVEMWKL
jgi:hypothetical protein